MTGRGRRRAGLAQVEEAGLGLQGSEIRRAIVIERYDLAVDDAVVQGTRRICDGSEIPVTARQRVQVCLLPRSYFAEPERRASRCRLFDATPRVPARSYGR